MIPVLLFYPAYEGFFRTHDLGGGQGLPQGFRPAAGQRGDGSGARSPERDARHPSERRVAQRAAFRQRPRGERCVVVVPRIAQHGPIRIPGLNNRFARQGGAPGASGYLRKQLIGAFFCPKIRQQQADIRIDHPDQRDALEVEAFRNHLRPHENIRLAFFEAAEQRSVRVFRSGGVQVHAHDARFRETRFQFLFYALRTGAKHLHSRSPARCAVDAKRLCVPAVMAPQAIAALVKNHRDRAVRAFRGPAATRAFGQGSVAAPILQEDDLFGTGKPLCYRRFEPGGQRDGRGRAAQVYNAYARQGSRLACFAAGPFGQGQQGIFPGLRIVMALQAGRRRSEDARGVVHARAQDGYVAGMIAGRRVLLFVGLSMLFVHHQQPEVRQGRQHGGSRSYDGGEAARPQKPPRIESFAGAHAGVQHRDAVAEMRPETPYDLGRERNFGNEHDACAPLPNGLLQGFNVHFRFAAARYAMQQKRAKAAGLDTFRNGPQRFGLRRMQRTLRERGGRARVEDPGANRFRLHDFKYAALRKTSERRGRGACAGQHIGLAGFRQAFGPVVGEGFDDRSLPGAAQFGA